MASKTIEELLNDSNTYARESKFDLAIESLNKALETVAANNNPKRRSMILIRLVSLYMYTSASDKAIATLDSLNDIAEKQQWGSAPRILFSSSLSSGVM